MRRAGARLADTLAAHLVVEAIGNARPVAWTDSRT